MGTVLIAGATGYLGRYTVKAFKTAGYTVRVLARDGSKLAQEGVGLAPAIRDDVDEIIIGDVTQPETLKGICEGVDVVFSSISLMGQKSKLTWHDVDYMGNKHILQEALAANVRKFVFVSVFNADKLPDIPIVKAHEDFAADLMVSGMDYAIIRPTGYFSDLGTYFEMAKSGRCYVFGDGNIQMNPLHGADLAQICLDAVTSDQQEIDAGGPVTYTWNEIAKLACDAAGKPTRITHLPIPLAKFGVKVMGLFNQHTAQLWDFFVSAAEFNGVAPSFGTHRLEDHYKLLS